MVLDLRTLFVATSVLGGVLGGGLLLLPRARRSEPSPYYWAITNFGLVSGAFLVALRGQVSAWLSIVVANIMIVVGLAALHAGILAFDRRQIAWSGPVMAVVLTGAGFFTFTYVEESLQARILLMSALCTAYGVKWVRALRLPGDGGTARRLMTMLCAGHTGFSVARAAATVVHAPGSSFLSAGGIQSLVGLECIVFVVMFNVAVLGMLHERLLVSLDRLASTDPLTETLNRRAFFHGAERILERARRDRSSVGFLVFDVDHFKAINDCEGHQAGDTVLREMAAAVRNCLRPADLFGRLGGEEFAAVVPHTPSQGAHAVAERVRDLVASSPFEHQGRTIHVTVSVGIARFPEDGCSLDSLLMHADGALYRAKTRGRNRVELARQGSTPAERVGEPNVAVNAGEPAAKALGKSGA